MAKKKKKEEGFVLKYAGTVVLFVVVILLYKYLTDAAILDNYLFPTVNTIGAAFIENEAKLFENLKASFGLLIPGVAIGLVIAFVLGVPMGLSGKFRRTVNPALYALSMLPVILLSPFAVHIAPTLRVASIFLVVWGTVWALMFSTVSGIMTIDKRYLDKAATLHITGFKKFTKVIMPAALPSITGGFTTSMLSAFASLVFAEMYGTQSGMGYFIKQNSDYGYFDKVWVGFVFLAIVMVIVMQLIELLKKRLLRWTTD